MSRKPMASTIVLNESLWCGGVQKTHKQIWDELLANGFDTQHVNFYLFSLSQHQPTPEQLAKDVKFVREHEEVAQMHILAALQWRIQDIEAKT